MNDFLSAKDEAERGLRDKCFNAGLNEEETELCLLYFIRRLSHKQISDMEKYKMTIETSRNKKAKFKKRLGGEL